MVEHAAPRAPKRNVNFWGRQREDTPRHPEYRVSSWCSIRRTWNTLTGVTRMKTRIDRKQGMASHLNGVHHHHLMAYDQLEEARNSDKQQPPSGRVDSLFGDPVEHPTSQTLEVQETAVAVAASITRDVKLDTTYAPTSSIGGTVSVFTSSSPLVLGKRFRLTAKGLEKTTSAQMTRGQVALREFPDVRGLIDLLSAISRSQALCASLPKLGVRSAPIVTKADLSANPGALARTTNSFEFPVATRGLLVLDYDPVGEPLNKDSLVTSLIEVCAPIAQAGVVWWCSGSSFIFNGEDTVQGLRGQRLYVMIDDIGDTERAGDVLCKRLWLAGHGRVDVSASGQMLLRSLFDKSMFQTARLDFIGGAVCETPLVQRRGLPLSVCGQGWLDTRMALPDLTTEEVTHLDCLVNEAKAIHQGEAEQARAAWKAARIGDDAKVLISSGVDAAAAHERVNLTLSRALEGELCGDFQITMSDGSLQTVSSLLANPQRWEGKTTYDPLEPGYDGGRVVGKLFLGGERPYLYSFAHGGKRYTLRRQPTHLPVTRGRSADLAEAVSQELIREPDVFVRGNQLTQIVPDGLMQLDRHSLRMLVGGRLGLYMLDKDGGHQPADLPLAVADMLMSTVRRTPYRALHAVLSLPCATPDGTLLMQSGYNPHYCVYLRLATAVTHIEDAAPTRQTLIDALQTLWKPWSLVSFASDCDRGGMLAAILTALSRPVLSTAPGFLFDAPAPSSGKTLIARALNALITGRLGAGLVPFKKDQQFDVELHKMLLTLSLSEGSVLQLDNVDGYFESPTLAAHLTSGQISGRLLGGHHWYEGAARLFFTLTSNNASLCRDLARRFVRVRIDAGVEVPQARTFPFQPDEAALTGRMDIARAAISLMRGFIAEGMPRIAANDAGFPEWTRLIRNAVLWVHQQGLDVESGMGIVGDPAHSLVAPPSVEDPKVAALRMLVKGVSQQFANNVFRACDISKICRRLPGQLGESEHLIRESLLDLHPGRQEMGTIVVGRLLSRMRDQIVDGVRMVSVGLDRNGVSLFRLQSISAGEGGERSDLSKQPGLVPGKQPMLPAPVI